MPEEPPWEWVEGDRGHAALYGAITGVLLIIACAVFLTNIVSMLNLTRVWPVPALPNWLESTVLLALIVGLFFSLLFPTRYPIVRRLGISPVGIRLVFPFYRRTVEWTAVKWVGPNYVDIRTWGGSQTVRLTPEQVRGISRFLRPA
ncbi:MAG: hypothetical protein WA549_03085 [Thermoplasmata archaeon]